MATPCRHRPVSRFSKFRFCPTDSAAGEAREGRQLDLPRADGITIGLPLKKKGRGITHLYRKNWVWLIQKIYKVDPLICPQYRGDADQLHRRTEGHQDHAESPWAVAHHIKTYFPMPMANRYQKFRRILTCNFSLLELLMGHIREVKESFLE